MPLDQKLFEQYLEQLARKANALKLSRRRFLQGAVALTSAHAPLVDLLDRTSFRVDGGRAVFFLDGDPRWTIDPSAFSGHPNLKILRNSAAEIVISLDGARYPGTQISADMLCCVRRGPGAWILKLDMPAYDWSGSTDLISWLEGRPIRFAMGSTLSLFEDDLPFTVNLYGGHTELNASWALDFDASTLAFPLAPARMRAARTTLRLASDNLHPLLGVPGKGSSVSILRSAHIWRPESELLKRYGWKLDGTEPFDFLQLDALESPVRGGLISAVFTPAHQGPLHLDIPGALQHLDGSAFSLSLERPAYAIVADGKGSLEATFSAPLRTESIAVAQSRALRFADKVTLTTDLLNSDVPDTLDTGLRQIYCEQFSSDEDTIFDFLVSGNHGELTSCTGSMPLDDVTLRVTRPQDFLHLDFTFANAKLEFRSNLPYIVSQDGQQAIMIVHFPPQHKLEETFEEDDLGLPDGPAPVRPVETTLSGPTRLAFDLTVDSRGLALTVQNLLAWSNYTMRAPGDFTSLPVPQQNDEHETTIEIPTRIFLKSVEPGKTMWNHASSADQDASPQLWHTELQAQAVHLLSAARSNNVVTLKFPGPHTWKAGQTIGILDPVDFAGAFVIKSVDAIQNTLTFEQNGRDVQTSPIDVSIANRFVAYSAADYAPPVTSFSWSVSPVGQPGPGITTITFAAPVTFQPGDVINVSDTGLTPQSCCGPIPAPSTDGILGVFLIEAVQSNNLTYRSAKNANPHPNLMVSMLNAQALSSATGTMGESSVTVTTQIANSIRIGEIVYIFGTNNKSVDGLNLTVAAVFGDGFSLTLNLPSPLTSALGSSTGLVVPVKLYPISQDDRRQIIDLDQQPQEPRPLAIEQLILSAIGSWTIFEGNFDPLAASTATQRYDVQKIVYRVAQARDYYVEVDYKGYYWPFGHNATLLKVTKRTFYSVKQNLNPQQNICYLRTQFFCALLEKTRVINTVVPYGLELPFIQVDIDTEITPALYENPAPPPTVPRTFSACNQDFFWPSISTDPNDPTKVQPFSFSMHGYDPADPSNPVPFSMPLIFVSSAIGAVTGAIGSPAVCPVNPLPASLCAVLKEYTDPARTALRTADFGGQSVHFATSLQTGDTEQNVGTMTFTCKLLNGSDPYDNPSSYSNLGEDPIAFRPILDYANIDVAAVNVFSGKAAASLTRAVSTSASLVKVVYPDVYIYNAFGDNTHPNPTQIYLEIKDDASLQFPGPQGGGMATPSAKMTGLSRNLGNTANVPAPQPTPADNQFDPTQVFGNILNSTLLGCIKLSDVIAIVGDIGSNLGLLPSLNLNPVFQVATAVLNEIKQIQTDIIAVRDAFASLNQAIQNPLLTVSTAIQAAIQNDLVKTQFPNGTPVQAHVSNPIERVQDLYGFYANSLQACLQELQEDAGCATILLQSDLDLLRAAGDIDLQTEMVSSVPGPLTILTKSDCYKKLSQDIVTAALAPFNLLVLPTKRIELTLDDIVSALGEIGENPDPTGPVSTVLQDVAALIQDLKNFVSTVVTTGQISPNLYAQYFSNVNNNVDNTLASNILSLKSTLLKVVNSHFAAFTQVRSQYTHCVTVTTAYQAYLSVVSLAQQFLQNQQTMAIDTAKSDIDSAVTNFINTLPTYITSDIANALSKAISQIEEDESLYQQVMQSITTPIAVSAQYTLASIPLQDAPPGAPIFLAHRSSGDDVFKSILEIDATVSAQTIPAAPTAVSVDYSTSIEITDFSLQLMPGLPFITVQFESFTFTSSKSNGTHSACKLDSTTPVILDDALGFVATLSQAFGPLAGDGGSGPILQLSGIGLGVGYEFGVPSIQAGGFQIVGLDFSALLSLSFTGDPLKLQFYMARPERHFLMSATIFGGGGFLGLQLSSAGVDDVSGCMEFGATCGLSILFATGEAHILGGIYFDYGDNRCVLTGYVRAGASLTVIDILSVSIEFYIGLTYENDNGQSSVYGTCTITVTISILFFSTTVPLTMQWTWLGSASGSGHSLALSQGTPAAHPHATTVNQRVWTEPFWKTYTAAFATE